MRTVSRFERDVTDSRSTAVLDRSSHPPRSWLFVPATRIDELLPKAIRSGADAVVVDLEDAVPLSLKDEARERLKATVTGPAAVPLFVRVNANAGSTDSDVRAAVSVGADGIMAPKVETADQVLWLAKLLAAAEADSGRATPLLIVPLVETAAGVLATLSIASADERVLGVAFGGEDLAANLGVSRTRSGSELRHARGHVVLAAVAAGRWALDSPSTDLSRPEQTAREARLAVALGYVGKLAIHPSQIAAINRAFVPTDAQVDAARRLIDALESARGEGRGAVAYEGRMVDDAAVRAARRVLTRAHLALGQRSGKTAPSEG